VDDENRSIGAPWLKKLTNWLLSLKVLDLSYLLSVILISGLFVIFTFDKLAPISEGWYVVYSDLILGGKIPYRDFELVFPPLYAYLMSFVTAVFGDSLFAFRVMGAFLFVGITVLSYYLFKLIFPSWIAAVAAIVTMIMLQSDAIFISYDYIFFFFFVNCLTFYLLLRPIVRSYRKEKVNVNLNLFLAGISCAFGMLFRQSTGAMVFVFFIVFLIFIVLFVKNLGFRRVNIFYFLTGVLLPAIITAVLLASAGALMPSIEMVLLSGVKGSMGSMLFGWLFRLFTDHILGVVVGTALAVCFIKLSARKTDLTPCTDDRTDHFLYFAFAGSVAIIIAVLFFSFGISSFISHIWKVDFVVTTAFVFILILGISLFINVVAKIRKGDRISDTEIVYLLFCGFFVVIGWGAGMSVNITPRHIALCFGFIVAIMIVLINKIPWADVKIYPKITAVALVAMFLVIPVAGKVVTPYDWLGLKTEPYSYAYYETDIAYFKGIKLTANEKNLYEDFVEKARLHLDDNDELYCYSQIPIFYTLAGKTPAVRSPVPWFDVANDQTVLDDLDYLKSNPPKMIIFADHGYPIMELQEKYYRNGGESGQRSMYKWLLECKDDPLRYEVIQEYDILNYKVYLLLRSW
jgi:4-amino-4-deoxy-L-arabinose transferase-like glycosyltransferase